MSHWTSRICSYLPEAGLRSKHQNEELKVIYIFLWQNNSNIPVTIRRQQTVILEKQKTVKAVFLPLAFVVPTRFKFEMCLLVFKICIWQSVLFEVVVPKL